MRAFVLVPGLALVAACGEPADTPEPTGEPFLPAPTGPCPEIVDGIVTFRPAGMPPRQVHLSLDPDAASDRGPLVFYWHATGSAPAEAAYALGDAVSTITRTGGIVAAPVSDPDAGNFEWFVVNGSTRLDDFLLADEIVACLATANRIDPTRIHAMGMSAGALQTTAMSFARSDYVASVATYSGGMPEGYNPTTQNVLNLFAALIFSGGVGDNVFGLDFRAASERYREVLDIGGHFAHLCEHDLGHEIPLDAAASVVTFFAAHGFGVWPSPYEDGLPDGFPSYCSR